MNADSLANSFPTSIRLPEEIRMLCDWVATNGYPISGYFELRHHDDETVRCWFGSDIAVGSLAQFGAGPDGGLYCVWKSPDGRFPIVHMGSEGQDNRVIADDAKDYLRLLAIGYEDIGSSDPSKSPAESGEEAANVNPEFQSWVREAFQTSIPDRGSPMEQAAQQGHPDFQSWIDAQTDAAQG